MDIRSTLMRASRGMREEAGLHIVAIASLSIAFGCLGAALLLLTNLGTVAERWGQSARMTVFLRDGAAESAVQELSIALSGLPEVESVRHLSAADARRDFIATTNLGADLASLPDEAFPASLEVTLRSSASAVRIETIAARVRTFSAVEELETYRGFFDKLERLLIAARGIAGGLAILVGLCVAFVVGNTIRLAVAGRREEIEVMKLCGATDAFVRGPFVVEGAIQGAVSATLAMLSLLALFLLLRDALDGSIATFTGVRAIFLHPFLAGGMVVTGALTGAAGSVFSLRRYLRV